MFRTEWPLLRDIIKHKLDKVNALRSHVAFILTNLHQNVLTVDQLRDESQPIKRQKTEVAELSRPERRKKHCLSQKNKTTGTF